MSSSPGCGDPPGSAPPRRSTAIAGGLQLCGSSALPRRLSLLRPPASVRMEQRRRSGGTVPVEDSSPSGSCLLCFSLSLPPCLSDRWVNEIRWGGHPARCTTRLYPEVYPVAVVFLFFPDQRSGLRRPTICHRFIIDTPEDDVVTAPSQAVAPMLVVKPSSPVSPPLQAPCAAGPRQASTRSEFAPTAVFVRTLPPMLLKEDARALFSCLVYHRHPPLTVLLLSSARSC